MMFSERGPQKLTVPIGKMPKTRANTPIPTMKAYQMPYLNKREILKPIAKLKQQVRR